MEDPVSSTLQIPNSGPPLESGPAGHPAGGSFAFLVHSQDTIPRNLPPSVDNKPLARQRRRRTSPEDQAILEAAFQSDSKPDKEARRQIVERVALGEKEVQIWFQNRRQNKRRKSQPPVSYEVLPRLEAVPVLTQPALPHGISSPSSSQSESNNAIKEAPAPSSSVSPSSPQSEIPSESKPEGHGQCETANGLEDRAQSASSSPSILWNKNSMHDTKANEDERTSSSQENTTPKLEHASSRVRLSMTSSGGAKIVHGAETTPSPPRSQPLAPTPFATRQTLRRSYSAAGLQESLDGRPGGLASLLSRKPSGRSRDSRAWEFWCDSDARNGLVKKAEQETSGSAADAIGLIRASSGRARARPALLTPNASRANVPAPVALRENGSTAKRAKKAHQDAAAAERGSLKAGKGPAGRAKLKRAMSSVARLQGSEKRHDSSTDATSVSPRGDSDKENLDPNGADGSRASAKAAGRARDVPVPVLREARTAGAVVGCRREDRKSSRAADIKEDAEVAAFMAGGKVYEDPEVEEGDDMDCVAGLLSLSQGNWG